MEKYYTFSLPMEAMQIRKMRDLWAECIGPDQPEAGMFAAISFKHGKIRGMIMPPDVCAKFKAALSAALAGAEKEDLGSI